MTSRREKTIDTCNWLIGHVGRVSLFLAATCLVLLTLIFAATIVFRAAGNSIPASDDIAVIILGGTFTLGFAYVMSLDDHLAVDLLTGRLDGIVGTVLRFILLIVTILIVGFLTVGLWHMLSTALRNNITMPAALPIPRAIPIGTVFTGVILFEIVLVLRLIERLAHGSYPQPERGLKEEFE